MFKTSTDFIRTVNGAEFTGEVDDSVEGYRSEDKKSQYFPRGLQNFFIADNFKFIAIWSAGLKELHQEDLAPFVNLKVFSLYGNEIEVLEKDLFKKNPKIEYLGLGQNKIKSVEGKVFRTLKNLNALHFDGNACASRQAVEKHDIWDLVEEINAECNK